MKHKLIAAAVAIHAVGLAGAVAHAQGSTISSSVTQVSRSYAGASFGSPLAFGADWGTLGVGIFGQTLPDQFNGIVIDDEDVDGSAAIFIGLGDANRYVGLETAIVTTSLTGSSIQGDDGFGESGGLAFKLHTNLPGGAAIALGVIGAARWGNAEDAAESSVYANATKVFALDVGGSKRALVATIGVGDGTFSDSLEDDSINLFGALAFYFTREVSLILDHTGRYTNLGVSVAPFGGIPLILTAGALNLAERFDSDVQFGGTLGYTFSF